MTTTTSEKLGVGIVGLGRVSRGHGNALKNARGARLVVACDIDESRVARFTDDHGCEGETDFDVMLQRPDVQVVDILLPHGLHEEATVKAAKAGKHIMVEKPMAMDVAAADRMIAAAKDAGVHLFIAHTERFIEATRVARGIIESGQIGTPVMATDVWFQPFRRETRQPWMLDRSRGGGFLQMAGSHMIDRLVYLVGSNVKNVRASVKTSFHPDIKCDDAVLAFLEMENGVPCTFATTSYKDTENAGVEAHATEIHCTDGMVKVDKRSRVYVSKGGQWEEVPVGRDNAVLREWDRFAETIAAGQEPPVPLSHARHVVAVMEACEESSASGKTVAVS
ncbi:MAG TPA: Gfo/Idh/MocA family oxidoreductase [Chloroflexota bacterium]|nr:Gfo/Idh/MocA family oxidoreductase [Chloroflexota bacterium]